MFSVQIADFPEMFWAQIAGFPDILNLHFFRRRGGMGGW